MAEQLQVQLRDTRGKRRNRRMRAGGQIPAILYGHGEKNVALAVPADAIHAVIRHGHQIVELSGSLSESALIRTLQWNPWGTEILHVDLTRVSAHERIEVTVVIELRGEAPGTKEGGVIEHNLHELEIECEAMSIPEKIEVSVNELKLGDALTVADLKLPEGIKALLPSEEVVVQCVEPAAEEEVEAEVGEAEPEVIGRKKEDEEGEEGEGED